MAAAVSGQSGWNDLARQAALDTENLHTINDWNPEEQVIGVDSKNEGRLYTYTPLKPKVSWCAVALLVASVAAVAIIFSVPLATMALETVELLKFAQMASLALSALFACIVFAPAPPVNKNPTPKETGNVAHGSLNRFELATASLAKGPLDVNRKSNDAYSAALREKVNMSIYNWGPFDAGKHKAQVFAEITGKYFQTYLDKIPRKAIVNGVLGWAAGGDEQLGAIKLVSGQVKEMKNSGVSVEAIARSIVGMTYYAQLQLMETLSPDEKLSVKCGQYSQGLSSE